MPYLHDRAVGKGLVLRLGNSKSWIETGKMHSNSFISGHNITELAESAAAFNIGSDILEAVDKGVLAPRVFLEKGNYKLAYPLPQRASRIPGLKRDEQFIKRYYEVAKMDKDIRINDDGRKQEIENKNGIITIEDGMCLGKGFKGDDACRASWVIAKIMIAANKCKKAMV